MVVAADRRAEARGREVDGGADAAARTVVDAPCARGAEAVHGRGDEGSPDVLVPGRQHADRLDRRRVNRGGVGVLLDLRRDELAGLGKPVRVAGADDANALASVALPRLDDQLAVGCQQGLVVVGLVIEDQAAGRRSPRRPQAWLAPIARN